MLSLGSFGSLRRFEDIDLDWNRGTRGVVEARFDERVLNEFVLFRCVLHLEGFVEDEVAGLRRVL